METVLMSEMFAVGAWKRETDVCSYSGWLLVHNIEHWTAVQKCWASDGCDRLLGSSRACGETAVVSLPQCCVTETAAWCHAVSTQSWAAPYGCISLNWCQLRCLYYLQTWARLNCLFNSFLVSYYMMKYLSSTLLILTFRNLFLGGPSTHGAFQKPEESGGKEKGWRWLEVPLLIEGGKNMMFYLKHWILWEILRCCH